MKMEAQKGVLLPQERLGPSEAGGATRAPSPRDSGGSEGLSTLTSGFWSPELPEAMNMLSLPFFFLKANTIT